MVWNEIPKVFTKSNYLLLTEIESVNISKQTMQKYLLTLNSLAFLVKQRCCSIVFKSYLKILFFCSRKIIFGYYFL